MCTPSLAIDALIEVTNNNEPSIVLVKRGRAPRDIYAIPGGFVDVGESVEEATIREVKEETNLELKSLRQFKVYSDPKRDKRRHTVSAVMTCTVDDISKIHRGDDAKEVVVVPLRKVLSLELAFDHKQILSDFISSSN